MMQEPQWGTLEGVCAKRGRGKGTNNIRALVLRSPAIQTVAGGCVFRIASCTEMSLPLGLDLLRSMLEPMALQAEIISEY